MVDDIWEVFSLEMLVRFGRTTITGCDIIHLTPALCPHYMWPLATLNLSDLVDL